MSDATTKIERHYVAVYFKGHESAAWVPMETRAHATGTVFWLASTYLRKHPSDRSGTWCPSAAQPRQILTEQGVGETTDVAVLGAFDPRDICGVQVVTRATDAWEESA